MAKEDKGGIPLLQPSDCLKKRCSDHKSKSIWLVRSMVPEMIRLELEMIKSIMKEGADFNQVKLVLAMIQTHYSD